jgi:hypothetical protein
MYFRVEANGGLFYLNLSALTSERQDGRASCFSLILLTLKLTGCRRQSSEVPCWAAHEVRATEYPMLEHI